jgi:hypothetical protein
MARGIAVALIGIALQLAAIAYGVSPLMPSANVGIVALGGFFLVVAGAALEFHYSST